MSKKVYLIQSELEGVICYKIGFTSRTGKKRSEDLYTSNPSEMTVLAEYDTPYALILEQNLHKHFNQYRIRGEWYSSLSGLSKEMFLDVCEKYNRNFEALSENEWFKKMHKRR